MFLYSAIAWLTNPVYANQVSNQFLLTKCHIPPGHSNDVPRPRLLAQLQASVAAERKLSLISAPAGYGKSTLVTGWLQMADLPVAWLTLDEHDNEFGRFLAYLHLTLQQLWPEVGHHLQTVLDEPQLPPLEEITTSLLADFAALAEQLAGAGNGRFLLILDDYHKIHQPPIHELLQQLLDHLPSTCHLVLISREDPPLALPRLRVRGQITELRAQDLRFTVAEASQFFNQVMGLNLAPDWIAALEARTEGWIASLQLVALSLQGRSQAQTEAFIRDFGGSHRYVFDYLAEEVLVQQPPEMQTFLWQTAVLDRFHAPLCQAVTGRHDSQALLYQLEQANLFLIPLDEVRHWFRYHHLFADYLRSDLAPAERTRLLTLAASWCEANGLLFEAVHYALASGDQNLAADVVERSIQRTDAWSGGELATLVSWIDALPGKILRLRPRLSLHASRALFLCGRLTLSEQFLNQAEQALRQNPTAEDAPRLLALTAVYRAATAALRGELPQAIELAQQAQADLPETDLHARARAADALGLAYNIAGDLKQMEQAYLQASDLAQLAGVDYLVINARCEAAQAQIGQGQLDLAGQTCQQLFELVTGTLIPPLGLAWIILGQIAYEQNDLATTEQHLQKGMALAKQGGLTDDLRSGYLLQARLQRANGDLPGAAAAVEQAIAIMQTFRVPRLSQVAAACQAHMWLLQGDGTQALTWAKTFMRERSTETAVTNQDFETLTAIRVFLAHDELTFAWQLLKPLRQQVAEAGRVRSHIEAVILQALLHQAAAEQEFAVAALAQAVQLAAPCGFLRLFVDEGPSLARLLPLVRQTAPAFVQQLLAALPHERMETAVPPNFPQLEALSEQEGNVLHLVCAGLSNQQIANELVISVGTAKWHVHNILQKLDVSSRTQAAVRARELGLVE